MKKRLAILSLIIASVTYGEEFYEDSNSVILKDSIISTTGFETTIRETAKKVEIITQEEIQENNYLDVTQALKDTPIINIRENQFGPIIDMRGQGSNSKATVQVLVDGVNINPVDQDHGTIPLNSVPIDNVERIEILPGGGGVLYGDGATGGVINIITKAATTSKPTTYVGARAGSYSSYQYNAGTGAKIGDDLLLQVNYSGENSNGYRDSNTTKRDYIDLAANYQMNDTSSLKFKAAFTKEETTSADMLTLDEVNSDRRQDGIDRDGTDNGIVEGKDREDRSKLERQEYSGEYNKALSDSLDFKLAVTYQETENKFDTLDVAEGWKEGQKAGTNKYYSEYKGTFTEEKTKVSPSIKYSYGRDSYAIFGAEYEVETSTRDFDNFLDMYAEYNMDMEKTAKAIYGFNKTNVTDKVQLMAGYRWEETSYDVTKKTHYQHTVMAIPGRVPTPITIDTGLKTNSYTKDMSNDAFELGLNFLYSETGNIYARVENSFRTPAPNQMWDKYDDPNGGDQEYWINDLDAETNTTFEVGLNDYILGSYVNIAVFNTTTKNEIYYDEISHGSEWYFYNLDETNRYGAEVSLEQLIGKFTFFENFTYLNSEIKDSNVGGVDASGNEVPYASKINFTIGAKYDINPKMNIVLSGNYKDSYYLDRENTYKVDNYFVTDLAINYNYNANLKLYAGINNLLDENYYSNVGISGDEMVYNPAASRNYYGGFKYNF